MSRAPVPASAPVVPPCSTKAAARMEVPLLDLKGQFRALKAEMMPVLEAVLDSQLMINGPAVKELEAAVAAYSVCAHGIGMSSGTDALLCAMMAMEIGPGDEVVTSPYTFFATAGCIARLGAKPVFVDIEPATFNMDSSQITAAITAKTKAIMPVHLYGQVAEMDAINAIARPRGIAVIEDACQSIGAKNKGRPAGSMGTVGCFSFFPSKNLGGAGDGGMVVTQDAALAERIALFRNHGMHPKYYHKFIGGNFRLDTIQAAYLLVKLKHLDGWSAGRRKNAALYDRLLADTGEVTRPVVLADNESIYNQYVIRVPAARRDALRAHLSANGIGTEIYYPVCLHEQECFKYLGCQKGQFPHSERAAAETIALPIYPELTTPQIEYVAGAIRSFFA